MRVEIFNETPKNVEPVMQIRLVATVDGGVNITGRVIYPERADTPSLFNLIGTIQRNGKLALSEYGMAKLGLERID